MLPFVSGGWVETNPTRSRRLLVPVLMRLRPGRDRDRAPQQQTPRVDLDARAGANPHRYPMSAVSGPRRSPKGNECDDRGDWWPREYGRFPTYTQLRRIRQPLAAEKRRRRT